MSDLEGRLEPDRRGLAEAAFVGAVEPVDPPGGRLTASPPGSCLPVEIGYAHTRSQQVGSYLADSPSVVPRGDRPARRRRQTQPRQAHADRVRDDLPGRSCGLSAVNPASQPNWG